jgi:hypothetical protein
MRQKVSSCGVQPDKSQSMQLLPTLINTHLQVGVGALQKESNRFSGFARTEVSRLYETAKAVEKSLANVFTPLKQGVNEKGFLALTAAEFRLTIK